MASRLVLLLCLLFAAGALAAKPLGHQVCVASCYYSLLKVKFQGKDAAAQTACTNPLRVDSTYLCTRAHCGEEDLVPGFAWWSATCKKSTKVVGLDMYRDFTANATKEYLADLPTVEMKEKEIVGGLVLPSEKNWGPVHESVQTYVTQRDYGLDVRWTLYGFWALVILLGAISYAASFIPSKQTDQPDVASPKTGALSKFKGWVYANIFLSPTFGHHHHQPLGWFTVPLRFQSVVIFAYFIVHLALLIPHYHIFDNNYYYVTRKGQLLRYFADRLAQLMTASMPFVFLFGGRGNLLIYATGWSYRTFSIFHRWIAIILAVEGLIHGVVFSVYEVAEKGLAGYHDHLRTDIVFVTGITMMIILGLVLLLALGPLREWSYEFFKYMHIGLSVGFIVAFYKHIEGQFSGYYKVWVWACIGLWAGDYFMRLLRVLLMNYKTLFGRGTPALASYSEETGMIRLQVHPSVMSRRQTPGTYYFLYFQGWRMWQNHPFTLAGRCVEVEETSSSSEQSDREMEKKGIRYRQSGELKKEEYMTFMIKPRNGMTKHLRDSLKRGDSWGQRRLRVLLEGPYGTPARLEGYDNVLFIAGGSGITTVLPYMRTFFEDGGRAPMTKLAWVVRHEGFARDVLANDLVRTENAPAAATRLSMEFFVTDEGGKTSDGRFTRGRPDVDALVGGFVTRHAGRTAVFVCGPAEMADRTRASVMGMVNSGWDVDLHEAMYVW